MIKPRIHKWDPKQYTANAGFVPELGKSVLELLAPQPGERVLDLGCGDGALSLELSRFGCDVIGVDSSEEMVAAACSMGIEAHSMDGAALRFANEFDAVFSNATLHWLTSPEAAIAGVWQALRPEGRFVAEFGGSGNVATIIGAIEDALGQRGVTVSCPWFFPTPAEYSALLESAGFEVRTIELFPRPTVLPGDVRGWLETFAHHYTHAVAESERESLISEIVDHLRESIVNADGDWIADYVRLRFHAERPRAAA